jgi:hypothetical protein
MWPLTRAPVSVRPALGPTEAARAGHDPRYETVSLAVFAAMSIINGQHQRSTPRRQVASRLVQGHVIVQDADLIRAAARQMAAEAPPRKSRISSPSFRSMTTTARRTRQTTPKARRDEPPWRRRRRERGRARRQRHGPAVALITLIIAQRASATAHAVYASPVASGNPSTSLEGRPAVIRPARAGRLQPAPRRHHRRRLGQEAPERPGQGARDKGVF